MVELQRAAALDRFAPQRSSILPHNTVKLAASKATLELTVDDSLPSSSRHYQAPLRKAFTRRMSKQTTTKHPHFATFDCIPPPPCFALAFIHALFLPTLNEARMSARLQGPIV